MTEIKLTYPSKKYFLNAKENDGIFDINDNTVDVKSQTVNIKSKAFIGAKDSCQSVFIKTDPETGEFSALLPPLDYKLEHVRFVNENNPDYENGEIIEVLMKGYTLKDKVIRYSKVKVCKK